MKSPLILVLVVVGLVSLLAPYLKGGTPPSSEQPPAPDLHAAQLEVSAPHYPGEVVLARAGDGHFYADVTVAGVSSRMLVDTGASVLALTAADAEAMGIYWLADEVRPVARGANGLVLGVPVTLDRVQVGDLEATAVSAIVVPEGLAISLLGQSFLSHVERVEIDGEQMVLGS